MTLKRPRFCLLLLSTLRSASLTAGWRPILDKSCRLQTAITVARLRFAGSTAARRGVRGTAILKASKAGVRSSDWTVSICGTCRRSSTAFRPHLRSWRGRTDSAFCQAMSRAVSPTTPSWRRKEQKNDRALPLHERILYPDPKGQRPPRILHSPAHEKLDPIILDLIALICREHVLSWYSSISRDPDRAFIQQVAAVIIHVVQALEVRIAQVDLVELIMLELPALLERHIEDIDQAEEKSNSAHAHNLDFDHVFRLLQPHIAVLLTSGTSSHPAEPSVDKTYLRALADNLLRLLLPPEDYRAETERAIVREIVVNIILGNVFTRVAQPWFLHQTIVKILEGRAATKTQAQACDTSASKKSPQDSASMGDRALAAVSSLLSAASTIGSSLSTLYSSATASPLPSSYRRQPPLCLPWMAFVTRLLPPSPALDQAVHYVSLPLSYFSSIVNSLILYILVDRALTPQTMESLLQATMQGLFPDGHPPPKEEDPSPEEQAELKRRCEEAVARALPGGFVETLATVSADHQLG